MLTLNRKSRDNEDTARERELEIWDPFRMMRETTGWDPFQQLSRADNGVATFAPSFEVLRAQLRNILSQLHSSGWMRLRERVRGLEVGRAQFGRTEEGRSSAAENPSDPESQCVSMI